MRHAGVMVRRIEDGSASRTRIEGRGKRVTPPAEFLSLANRLAEAARASVRDSAHSFALEHKADGSPVTDVDRAAETAMRELLEAHVPSHGILGEEHESFGLDREFVWVLDPIDGTRQFCAGVLNFGVLIALCQGGRPVLGIIEQPLAALRWVGVAGLPTTLNGRIAATRPCADIGAALANLCDPDCITPEVSAGYEAVRGATRWNVYDGGCIGFGAMASGRVDLCLYGSNVDPFDICALAPVVEGAGGRISTWSGAPVTLETAEAVVGCGSAELHEEALTRLASAG